MEQVDSESPPGEELVTVAAYRLAVQFTEEGDLPVRFRRQANLSGKIRRVNEDSDLEQRFRAKVDAWRQLIEVMLSKIDISTAWRYINLCPEPPQTVIKVTDSKDFCNFIDYMILRRDVEHCGPSELGGLARLSVAFQREVEKQIHGR